MSVGTDTLPTDTLGGDIVGTQPPNEGLPTPPATTPKLDEALTPLTHALNPSMSPLGLPVPTGGNLSVGQRIIAAAKKYLGQPYSWGNLDCSGLVQRAYAAVGIKLPRISWDQARFGTRTSLSGMRPGDLVAWDNSTAHAGADHIAVFAGYVNGKPWVIEAPKPGGHVQYVPLFDAAQAFGVRMSW